MRASWLSLAAICACSKLPQPPAVGDLTVTVTSPHAGDEMLASDHPMIEVTGSVTTTSADYGVVSAWVNGTAVELAADGSFTAEVAPVVGINHIKVAGGDGYDVVKTQEMDVMWAPDYLAQTTGTSGYQVPDGLDLDLGQGFFDGRLFGTTLDLTTDPVVAHDLASSLELILWNIDLASLLSGGIHAGTGSSTIDVNIPAATPSEILVDAKIITTPDPSIELDIDLNGVFLSTTGDFHYNNRDLSIQGGISADMHASARLSLGTNPDGTIAVTAVDVTDEVGPLSPQFTGPNADELNAFITLGNNDFRTLVEGIIQNSLIPTFTDKVPPLLESLLGATDKLLDNVTFTLDAKLGTAVTLMLNGTIGSLEVVPGPAVGESPGHVTVHQTVSVQTANTPVHPDSRGAARVDMNPTAPPINTSTLHVTMKQDFLNTILHALWNSGLLEGNAMIGGINAGVSAKLQPFVRPTPDSEACVVNGERCDVTLQLGQLEVTLPDFNQSFAIHAEAGARVVVDGTTVSLVVQMVPTVTVWETSEVPGRLTPDAIHDLVQNVVWPELFGAIGDKLKITLPIPDLSQLGLTSLSPNLANAALQLDVRDRAAVTPGYLDLGANLELSTPKP